MNRLIRLADKQYEYIFQSPVKYLVETDDNNINDEIKDWADVDYIDGLEEKSYKLISEVVSNIAEYIGIDNNALKIEVFNNHLQITFISDHVLSSKEYNNFCKSLVYILEDTCNDKLLDEPVISVTDNIEYANKINNIEYKSVTRNIYCTVWQNTNWQLIFQN